jgi:hypothetical protein
MYSSNGSFKISASSNLYYHRMTHNKVSILVTSNPINHQENAHMITQVHTDFNTSILTKTNFVFACRKNPTNASYVESLSPPRGTLRATSMFTLAHGPSTVPSATGDSPSRPIFATTSFSTQVTKVSPSSILYREPYYYLLAPIETL